jgi:hypothetical protein
MAISFVRNITVHIACLQSEVGVGVWWYAPFLLWIGRPIVGRGWRFRQLAHGDEAGALPGRVDQ